MNQIMPQRFDGGQALIALGAVVLLVSLFLDWYGFGLDGSVTAWTSFEIIDLLLAGLAIGALAAIVAPRFSAGASAGRAGTAAALVAFVLVVVSLIDPPPAVSNAELEFGAWLALAATALMAIGAMLSLARISISVSVRGRDDGQATPSEQRDEVDDVPPEGTDEEDASEQETRAL
jgi:peptidoglycan/LPS O-acetylase OafA/YrhL